MKKYNHTTYAILGILTTDCKSGYAIKQLIDQSLNHFWKISYGQIYPTLKKIVEDGLAEVRTAATEGKPDRNEYFLTPKGIETLKRWLEQPVEQLPVERNEVLLKLFFGRYQSKQSTTRVLEDYKQKLEERYQTYVNVEQAIKSHDANQEDAWYWLCTLDYGKRATLAAIDWCTASLETFKRKEN
ncbi:PadR family transcriptional regulator [Halalkalibacterium halodurans]|uniref:BH3951 protein n=1 Tax=Halalkalibacterium halodurans (strain ATCC BAA-125 / DSM 18197 / FERM 7344 / JCM 9153 / C-125) TaxID=272558 RepID=Q9K5Y4_HALH5|nr:PadR family transcriptional regulator [Halalkalibacterium halodurans]MDY7224469.1 PadR family transcriptional regulator [Halalkalibacterium halodurans]MDY7243754.1 PadR family transcriptional regulator [Halalkalibacterium halodurans]MED4079664.1 PadR family transcriptional regulator [Halalkalibacterium halodurans]MED4084060.1 PadR family transcriptional regulator [Halalkalibacterium halodurans]MED4104538.1 PadR family transcriptional regulator [Halalkalibacterium halodurans]